MTDILVTSAHIGLADPAKAVVRSYIAAEAITKGNAVYITTAGKAGKATANTSGKKQFRGIALNTVGIGGAVDVLHDGEVEGFDVAALNGDALIYLSNTAGLLATAAGSTTVAAARVTVLTDEPTLTKILRVFTRWEADWS